jgi:hypothetical protein
MRTITNTLFLLLALGAPGLAAAQIYKCPDANGRTVIQQVPCQGGQAMDVRPASGYADRRAVQSQSQELARLKARNTIAEGIRTATPVTGMTEKELTQALGRADSLNTGLYGGTRKDQHVFYRPDVTWYVYTTDGIVESIQSSGPTPGMTASARPDASNCPSALTIRNAEVSASSGTLSAEERAARWRAIEDMRKCGRR